MSSSVKTSLFRKELCEFRAHCHENGLPFDKIVETVLKTDYQHSYRRILRLCLLVVMVTLCGYAFFDNISVHFMAYLRILMVQLLPFFDWRHLKHERCLLAGLNNNNEATSELGEIPQVNCNYCDAIDSVVDVSRQQIRVYFDLNVPILVEHHKSSVDFEQLLQDEHYAQAHVCDFESNVLSPRPLTVKDVYETFHYAPQEGADNNIDEAAALPFFFYHYRHCRLSDVKLFRRVFKRPRFLDSDDDNNVVRPVQHSWIVVSSKYNGSNFQSVAVEEGFASWVQIEGEFELRLLPAASACADKCAVLDVKVREGFALIVSNLWHILYRPVNVDARMNVAVILEAH